MGNGISTTPTGQVFLKDFDRGVVETLGAEVYTGTPVGSETAKYRLTIPGLVDAVNIIFATPEQPIQFNSLILPTIVVRRGDIVNALERWMSLGAYQYRTIPVLPSINGEEMVQAFPFDITYDLEAFARYRNDSVVIMNWILRKYQPYGKVWIKDSLGDTRSYECFMENISVADELADVADRMIALIISLRIAAELDLNDPTVFKVVTSINERTHLGVSL